MQLKKLSPAAGLFMAAILSACGGGGGDPPPPAAPPPPAITVSAVSLANANPQAFAEKQLQFDGGACGGGTGALTPSWDFGDGFSGPAGSHQYADSVSDKASITVTVTCTDTAGTTAGSASLQLNILPAAMQGFLGKSWTSYAALETNVSPYPVAGIAADSGDIYGVWIRRNGLTAITGNEVATGQTKTSSQSNWTVASSILSTAPDYSPYNDASQTTGETAAIDMAVSPDGHALAAWVAGSSIYYATRDKSNSIWTTPTAITSAGGTISTADSVKVVINNHGEGAIAYCVTDPQHRDVAGAWVMPYYGSAGTSKRISSTCDVQDSGTNSYQRHRAFDIAIENPTDHTTPSKLYAVGIQDNGTATTTPTTFDIAVQTYSSNTGPTATTLLTNGLTSAPGSVSLSLSPNGAHGAIAWSQTAATKDNIYVSMLVSTSGGLGWSAAAMFTHSITPTTDYNRPLIAVNDSGDAFMSMHLANASGQAIAVANYNASATPPSWSTEMAIDTSSGHYRATDIAIDKYGTGLITNAAENFTSSQAGTFAKKPGAHQWSGFKSISSSNAALVYYYATGFHYQTMRATPDGQAILVTSMYDDRTHTEDRISSGYMLLK